jgi:ribosome-associated heat shock protein Hsp15
MEGQRLDKWLWCARLVKTRSLAAKLIEGGKVRVNGERALKVSRHVRMGDVVTGTGAGRLFVVRVTGEAERRVPAPMARFLYEDLTPETPHPASGLARIEVHRGPRPTKRDRRRLDEIKGGQCLRVDVGPRQHRCGGLREQLLALYCCLDWARQGPSSTPNLRGQVAGTKG